MSAGASAIARSSNRNASSNLPSSSSCVAATLSSSGCSKPLGERLLGERRGARMSRLSASARTLPQHLLVGLEVT